MDKTWILDSVLVHAIFGSLHMTTEISVFIVSYENLSIVQVDRPNFIRQTKDLI